MYKSNYSHPILNRIILILILSMLFIVTQQSNKQFIEILQNTLNQQSTEKPKLSKYQQLNFKLQNLDDSFYHEFAEHYTYEKIKQLKKYQKGQYLFLIAKMYLYDIYPQNQQWRTKSRYVLAYNYLKSAAQKYENSDAYYYLALLEYLKLVPTLAIQKNIQNSLNKSFQTLKQDLKTMHLHNIQHNLYLASLLGNVPASQTLGYMYKEGIATNKNCTSSIGYYLYALKNTKIDIFQYPSELKDFSTFQEQIYSHHQHQKIKKIDKDLSGEWNIIKQNIGNYDISTLQQTGLNYHYGMKDHPIDYEKSFQILNMIKQQSQKARMLVKFMTLKGLGTQKNMKKAKDLFFMDSDKDKVSYEMYLILQYFSKDSKRRETARILMQQLFENYLVQKQQKQAQKQSDNLQDQFQQFLADQKGSAIQTQIMKFIIGTLLVSQQINGQKQQGIYLISQSAHSGNTLALSYMGLLFLQGSDLSYDCIKAANYFGTQAYSHQFFQLKSNMAKKGLNLGKNLYSLIKYTQLMMIGHKNSFINAYYVLNQKSLFDFNNQSWLISSAQENPHYKLLLVNGIVQPVSKTILQQYNIIGEQAISTVGFNHFLRTTQQISKQYTNYAKMKVSTLGIKLHDISILKYEKYLKNKDSYLLHNLANKKTKNALHILESRYLLGKFYQFTNQTSSDYQRRIERSYKEYYRATNDELLANLIFFINGFHQLQNIWDSQIVRHFTIFLGCIFGLMVFLNWQRNRNISEIIGSVSSQDSSYSTQQVPEQKQINEETQITFKQKQIIPQQNQRENQNAKVHKD